MTETLKNSRELARSMPRPATGASEAYLAARTLLLEQEIELRRQMERVSQLRRALPEGPAIIQDYRFDGLGADAEPAKLALSGLFRPGTDTLLIYSYMFPRHNQDARPAAKHGEIAKLPRDEQPCPSCTALLDQLNAATPHFEAGGANFAVVAETALPNLLAVARDRDWRHLRLLSSAGTSFKRDFNSIGDDGQQAPMTLVFKKDDDGTVRLFWASDLCWVDSDPGQDPRAAGTIEPFWNMFDLTPGGRPDFAEQLEYDCCHGRPAALEDVA